MSLLAVQELQTHFIFRDIDYQLREAKALISSLWILCFHHP